MPSPFDPLIAKTEQKYGLPPGLLAALVKQESGFNPKAVSPAGAQGLTQLMPATARGLGVTDPFNPQQNLAGGARYLKQQLDKFGRLDLALSAYNSGPGGSESRGRVESFGETQNYVKSILAALGGSGKVASPGGGSQPSPRGTPAAGSSSRQAALDFIFGPELAGLFSQDTLRGSVSPPKGRRVSRSGTEVQVSGASKKAAKGLLPDFERKLAALIAAVRAQGGDLSVTSGFRSVAHQRELWKAALKKYGSAAAARKWVAPPGRSNHNKGIAADLRGDLELAAKLAPRFGLYRPMSWEPWHFEPQGSRK